MSDSATASAAPDRNRLIAAVLLSGVALFEMAAELGKIDVVQKTAWVFMVALLIFRIRQWTLRDFYLLAVGVALAIVVYLTKDTPWAIISRAIDQATFMMAFIILLGLLYETASTSPSVAICGEYLTRQPPSRRYYALYVGSAVLAVLFNVGVLAFLVPLIQRGVERATPGDALNPIRLRRQITPLVRGFSWGVIWSPTAFSPLVLVQLMPDLDRARWTLYGVAIFIIMMIVGGLEDRIRFRRYRPVGPRISAEFPLRAAAYFVVACAALFTIVGVVVSLTGESVVVGLLVACPVMMVGWLFAQAGRDFLNAGPAVRARISVILGREVPGSVSIAMIMALSGFIGSIAAALVPASDLSEILYLNAVPDYVLLWLISVLVLASGQMALTPMAMAVFFGTVVSAMPVKPADPTLIALAISCGWALTGLGSPFSAATLLCSRATGIPAQRLAWSWNWAFAALALLVLVPVYYWATGGQ
ncbi:MAG: hypothetical protein H6883_10470 [Rhodobiaceae bacterium]|nr:hypothetical protein [Rhodobiaceae bacterium]MCC0056552.1 hypothetical protein [Rhodobiaceae bacterium]